MTAGRLLLAALAAADMLAIAAPVAAAQPALSSGLHRKPGGARHGACATLDVPADYDQPHGTHLHTAVAGRGRDPKHRIGTLVFNLSGPGDMAVEPLLAAEPKPNHAPHEPCTTGSRKGHDQR